MKKTNMLYGVFLLTVISFFSMQCVPVAGKKPLMTKPTSYAPPRVPAQKVQIAQPQVAADQSDVASNIPAVAPVSPRKTLTGKAVVPAAQVEATEEQDSSAVVAPAQGGAGQEPVIKATKSNIQAKLLAFFKNIPAEIKKTLQLIKYESSVLDCSIMLDLGDGKPLRVGFSIDFGFAGSGLDSTRVAIRNEVGDFEMVTIAPYPIEKGFPKAKINIYPKTIPLVGLPTEPIIKAACKFLNQSLINAGIKIEFYDLLFNPQPDALCALNVLKLGFSTLNDLTVAKKAQQLSVEKTTEISVNFLTRILDNIERLSYSVNEEATLKVQGKEPGEQYDPNGQLVFYQGLGDSINYYAKAFNMQALVDSLKLPFPEELYYWYKLQANAPASVMEKALGEAFMLDGYTQQVQAFNTKVLKLITNKLDYFDRKALMDALAYFVKTLDKGCGDPKKVVGVVKTRTDGALGKPGVIKLFGDVIQKMKLAKVFGAGRPGTKDQPDQPDYIAKANELLTQIKNRKAEIAKQAAKGGVVIPAAPKIAAPSLAAKPLKTISIPITEIANVGWAVTTSIFKAQFPGDAGYVNERYKQAGLFETIMEVLKIGNKVRKLIPVAKKAFLASPAGKAAQVKINAPVKALVVQLQAAGADAAKKKQIMQKLTLATIKANLDIIIQAVRFSFKRAPNIPAQTIIEFVVQQFGLLYRKSELFSSLGQVLVDPILKPILGITLEELMPNIENSAAQEEQQELDKMQSELADLGIDLGDLGDMGEAAEGPDEGIEEEGVETETEMQDGEEGQEPVEGEEEVNETDQGIEEEGVEDVEEEAPAPVPVAKIAAKPVKLSVPAPMPAAKVVAKPLQKTMIQRPTWVGVTYPAAAKPQPIQQTRQPVRVAAPIPVPAPVFEPEEESGEEEVVEEAQEPAGEQEEVTEEEGVEEEEEALAPAPVPVAKVVAKPLQKTMIQRPTWIGVTPPAPAGKPQPVQQVRVPSVKASAPVSAPMPAAKVVAKPLQKTMMQRPTWVGVTPSVAGKPQPIQQTSQSVRVVAPIPVPVAVVEPEEESEEVEEGQEEGVETEPEQSDVEEAQEPVEEQEVTEADQGAEEESVEEEDVPVPAPAPVAKVVAKPMQKGAIPTSAISARIAKSRG